MRFNVGDKVIAIKDSLILPCIDPCFLERVLTIVEAMGYDSKKKDNHYLVDYKGCVVPLSFWEQELKPFENNVELI